MRDSVVRARGLLEGAMRDTGCSWGENSEAWSTISVEGGAGGGGSYLRAGMPPRKWDEHADGYEPLLPVGDLEREEELIWGVLDHFGRGDAGQKKALNPKLSYLYHEP